VTRESVSPEVTRAGRGGRFFFIEVERKFKTGNECEWETEKVPSIYLSKKQKTVITGTGGDEDGRLFWRGTEWEKDQFCTGRKKGGAALQIDLNLPSKKKIVSFSLWGGGGENTPSKQNQNRKAERTGKKAGKGKLERLNDLSRGYSIKKSNQKIRAEQSTI